MNSPKFLLAARIGHLASLPEAGETPASVLGSTSRGVFLLDLAGQVLFLSYEAHPGPLSVNLGALPPAGRLDVRPGQAARLTREEISLPSGEHILLAGAERWQPAALPATRASASARRASLRQAARLALAAQPQAGLVPLLARLLDLPGPALPAWQQPFETACRALAQEIASPSVQASLEALLGLGGGLTPSGDDFLAGLFLALNRRGPGDAPRGGQELSQTLVQAARRRTNALSAALLAAAAQGSADQRLLSAWDGLLCGTLPAEEVYEQLAAYGNSSGLDALAGFATAFLLIH